MSAENTDNIDSIQREKERMVFFQFMISFLGTSDTGGARGLRGGLERRAGRVESWCGRANQSKLVFFFMWFSGSWFGYV